MNLIDENIVKLSALADYFHHFTAKHTRVSNRISSTSRSTCLSLAMLDTQQLGRVVRRAQKNLVEQTFLAYSQ